MRYRLEKETLRSNYLGADNGAIGKREYYFLVLCWGCDSGKGTNASMKITVFSFGHNDVNKTISHEFPLDFDETKINS
jgi:hypothetical protein